MILSYGLRLLCLSLTATGLVQLVLECAAWGVDCYLYRSLQDLSSCSSRRQSRVLFLLQVSPPSLAILFTAFICIPAYLCFELKAPEEKVGLGSVLLAGLIASFYLCSLGRGAVRYFKTRRLMAQLRKIGQIQQHTLSSARLLIIPSTRPVMALIGVLNPCVVVSRGLYDHDGIEAHELEVAIAHEVSHWVHRDNLKMLCLVSIPFILPRMNRSIRTHWELCTEWAADDAACDGDGKRALILAQSLISFSRIGQAGLPSSFSIAFVGTEQDLVQRVSRLIARSALSIPADNPRSAWRKTLVLLFSLGPLVVFAFYHAIHAIYLVIESLLHV